MIWKEIQFENILLKILENFSASCLETKMINDHRLFSTAPVADIPSQFLLNTIIAHFEKMTLRLHGVNLIYYMPSHCTDILTWKQRASVWYLEQQSQHLILGTSSLLKIIKSLFFSDSQMFDFFKPTEVHKCANFLPFKAGECCSAYGLAWISPAHAGLTQLRTSPTTATLSVTTAGCQGLCQHRIH